MENKPEDIADIPRTWRPAWRPQSQAAPNCAHVLSRESWDRAWYLKMGIYKICISNIYIYSDMWTMWTISWLKTESLLITEINMTIESNWINAFPDSVPTFCLKECQSEDEDTKHETAVLQLPNPNSICGGTNTRAFGWIFGSYVMAVVQSVWSHIHSIADWKKLRFIGSQTTP